MCRGLVSYSFSDGYALLSGRGDFGQIVSPQKLVQTGLQYTTVPENVWSVTLSNVLYIKEWLNCSTSNQEFPTGYDGFTNI